MNDTNIENSAHIGKRILETLKKYENDINQIEVVHDTIETHGSVRLRSIRMAQALKSKGIKKGDVILLDAVNHNDLCIPYLAALYIGAAPLGISTDMKHAEIKHVVSIAKPSYVFVDSNLAPSIQKALEELEIKACVVTFGDEKCEDFEQFKDYVKETGTEENFQCENFDPKTTMATLACSSGTTGLPKIVAISHYAWYITFCNESGLSVMERRGLVNVNFSPLYWVSASTNMISSCLVGNIRVQSVKPFSPEEFHKASKIYNASATILSQVAMCSIAKYAEINKVDFPSYRLIIMGGSSVSDDAVKNIKKYVPNAILMSGYGATELLSVSVAYVYKKGSCGKPNSYIDWKIVDVETGKKLGVNQEGEFCLKTPAIFMGYYNNPEATKAAFDNEGYFKTGDLVYYDEDDYLYIVDRIKELIKFRNYQVSSTEMENLINDIPGVVLSGVVGLPHPEDGEYPMAFVQLEPGATVSKQKIMDIVKETMSDSKQLRGGVVFVDTLPVTYSDKVNRKQLREMKKKYCALARNS